MIRRNDILIRISAGSFYQSKESNMDEQKVKDAAKRSVKIARARLGESYGKLDLIIEAIEADICDRRGLKSVWCSIDQKVLDEDIKPTWKNIIQEVIRVKK